MGNGEREGRMGNGNAEWGNPGGEPHHETFRPHWTIILSTWADTNRYMAGNPNVYVMDNTVEAFHYASNPVS